MEVEKKSAGDRKREVKLGELGGAGGMVVLGGALVAGTVWSICEFRRRREKPSGKKGTLKDFQTTPTSEKVKNVDGGGDGLRFILRNPKLLDGSETEERDVSSDASALKLLLDVEKILEPETVHEEKIEEGKKIEDDGDTNESMVLILKDEGLTCEAVHEMKQEAVEVCNESLDADPFSSVSEDDPAVSGDELGIRSQLDEDSRLMEDAEVKIGHNFRASGEGIKVKEMREVVHLESLADGGIKFEKEVHPATPANAVDDDSKDVVSEDLDYEVEDGSDGSSGGMTDSSAESIVEIWPVESLGKLSQGIRNEKTLNEVVKADDNAELISASNGNWITANGIHQKECFDDHVSMYNRGPGSTPKGQMVGNSTRLSVWVSSVLLTLLVLLAALLAHQTYHSPALTGKVSHPSPPFLIK